MNVETIKKVSCLNMALIWSIGGICVFFRGLWELLPQLSDNSLLMLLCIVLGMAKGVFVIRKPAQRMIKNINNLSSDWTNLFIGFLKAIEKRDLIVIVVMIVLAILCNMLLDEHVMAFIRLTIGSALLSASLFFWSEVRPVSNSIKK